MFRCYFESKAYTKDVMVKNQHFRWYHENKEIEYFQKFRSLCTLIACVMSPCFNYRLTTPPHTSDKLPDLISWNLIPFFKKSLSELLYRCWLHGRDETAVCNISQACSIGFRSGDLAGHSIRTIVA